MTLDLVSGQGESEGEISGSAKALPQLSAPHDHFLIAFPCINFLYVQMLVSDPEPDLTIMVTVSVLCFLLPWNSQGLFSHWDITFL